MNEADLLKLVASVGTGGGAIVLAIVVWRSNERLIDRLATVLEGVVKENTKALTEVRDALKK